MELNREQCDLLNFRRGLIQLHELNSIFVAKAPSRTSVYRWYVEFNRGFSSLEDKFREGHLQKVFFYWPSCSSTF